MRGGSGSKFGVHKEKNFIELAIHQSCDPGPKYAVKPRKSESGVRFGKPREKHVDPAGDIRRLLDDAIAGDREVQGRGQTVSACRLEQLAKPKLRRSMSIDLGMEKKQGEKAQRYVDAISPFEKWPVPRHIIEARLTEERALAKRSAKRRQEEIHRRERAALRPISEEHVSLDMLWSPNRRRQRKGSNRGKNYLTLKETMALAKKSIRSVDAARRAAERKRVEGRL